LVIFWLNSSLSPYVSRSCDFDPLRKKTTKPPLSIDPFALLAPKVNFDSVYADVAPTSLKKLFEVHVRFFNLEKNLKKT